VLHREQSAHYVRPALKTVHSFNLSDAYVTHKPTE